MMSQVVSTEPRIDGAPRTSKPGIPTFCNSVIGAFDTVTGDLAHALLIAMFPGATDIFCRRHAGMDRVPIRAD